MLLERFNSFAIQSLHRCNDASPWNFDLDIPSVCEWQIARHQDESSDARQQNRFKGHSFRLLSVTYVHFEALLGCGRSAFVCRGIQALGGNTSKSEVTRVSKTASKSAVDPKSAARLVLRPARGVLTATLLAAAAFAQNSADPAPSTVVSNSTEIIKHGSIKPEKSAAANESSDAIAVDPASLLPELPPLPNAKATLIGGTIGRLDRVRDQVTLNIFGGGHATVLFDPRTKVYRGSKEISIADIREGERAYLDTILDGSTVFARAIRLSGASAMGESEGVVLKYRPERG
jgi:hypothetical protein